ncbi:MAG: hypothetical protein ACM3U2_23805 [Deltaproteobacteria bacterium]
MKRAPRNKQKPGGRAGRPRDPDEEDDDHVPPGLSPARLQLKRLDGNRFAFQPPICAVDRKEDLDEVHQMIAGGELEIARDELLYLVSDCRGFLEAHNLLGELALEENDLALARGHFGFAYEIGLDSLPKGFRGLLPAKTDYNRPFFLAGRGLARCLISRGKRAEGREVLRQLSRFDPREENVRALLGELEAEGKKRIVDGG